VQWADQRRTMVDRQLRKRGIRDERVLHSMGSIPREEFVPEDLRHAAYEDAPVDIGFGQTISQPYMTALMVEALELQGYEKVLEIGAGSGYHAAVLAALSAGVISIEIIPELVEESRSNLRRVGLQHKVRVIRGDGSSGFEPEAPYDAISVAAGAPEVPHSLLEQLADPGRLVIPVGSMADQDLHVIDKSEGRFRLSVQSGCRFVPLRGEQGWR
jgi:protein-L-isoaspartate(D-aspartate) O-methyltransferase